MSHWCVVLGQIKIKLSKNCLESQVAKLAAVHGLELLFLILSLSLSLSRVSGELGGATESAASYCIVTTEVYYRQYRVQTFHENNNHTGNIKCVNQIISIKSLQIGI